MKKEHIDGGKAFDWSNASASYAKYRDIYPPRFYQYLLDRGLCTGGQRVLDIGTGTGVLPRNLYPHGASFVGADVSEGQIAQAKRLAGVAGMDIAFLCAGAEELEFSPGSFDTVTACQCFTYFDHERLAPRLSRFLREGGRFAVLYMAWLPFEDEIAHRSEQLVLKYNPAWTGGGEVRRPIQIPEAYAPYFEVERQDLFDLAVPFTREGWNGRMRSCRGIDASLPEEEAARFEAEHLRMLRETAPEQFEVLHYAAAAILRKKESL